MSLGDLHAFDGLRGGKTVSIHMPAAAILSAILFIYFTRDFAIFKISLRKFWSHTSIRMPILVLSHHPSTTIATL